MRWLSLYFLSLIGNHNCFILFHIYLAQLFLLGVLAICWLFLFLTFHVRTLCFSLTFTLGDPNLTVPLLDCSADTESLSLLVLVVFTFSVGAQSTEVWAAAAADALAEQISGISLMNSSGPGHFILDKCLLFSECPFFLSFFFFWFNAFCTFCSQFSS